MKMFVAKITIIMMCNYLETKNAPKYFWSVFTYNLILDYFLKIVCFLSGPTETIVIGISNAFSKKSI